MEQRKEIVIQNNSKQLSNYSFTKFAKISHFEFFSFGKKFPCFWTYRPLTKVFKAFPLKIDKFVREDHFLSYCFRFSLSNSNSSDPTRAIQFQNNHAEMNKKILPKNEKKPENLQFFLFTNNKKENNLYKPKTNTKFQKSISYTNSKELSWGTHIKCSIFLGTESGQVLEVDAISKELLSVVKLHESAINCLHFSWNQHLITFSADKKIRIWDSDLVSLINEIELSYSATSVSLDSNLKMRYFETGNKSESWLGLEVQPLRINKLHLVSSQNFIGEFDFIKGRLVKQYFSDESPIVDHCFDPRSKKLVFVNQNKKIGIFGLPSLKLEYEFFSIERTPSSLAFFSDPNNQQTQLLVGYKEGWIEAIDLQTWKVINSCDIQEQLTFKNLSSQSQRDLNKNNQRKIKYLFSPRKKKGPKKIIKINLRISRLVALEKTGKIIAQIRQDFILILNKDIEILGTLAVYNMYETPITNFLLKKDPFEKKLVHSFDDFSLSLNCIDTIKSRSYIETETKIIDFNWGRGDSFLIVMTESNSIHFYKQNAAKGVFDYLNSLVSKYREMGEEMIIPTSGRAQLTDGDDFEQSFKVKERKEKLREIYKFLKEELNMNPEDLQGALDEANDEALLGLYNSVLGQMVNKGDSFFNFNLKEIIKMLGNQNAQ